MSIIKNGLAICILVTVFGCFGSGDSHLKGIIFINEFMASNSKTIVDEKGDHDDWIELYNAGNSSVNLGSMCITDDFAFPKKWVIPETTIAAGGFLLFWADGEESEGSLHTNFKLNATNGEEIGLFDPIANGDALIDAKRFDAQPRDTSYGRSPDGENDWQFFSVPTPGKANGAGK